MMKKRTILKRAVAGIGVLSLLVGISPVGLAGAYEEYHNTFKPPFAGCAEKEGPLKATNDPYVSPSGSTMSTTYVLIIEGKPSTVVSDHIKTGSKGKRNFTYKSGYGGGPQEYSMQYYPTKTDFLEYYVEGKWQA